MPKRLLALFLILVLISVAHGQFALPGALPTVPLTARAGVSAEPLLPGTDAEIAVEMTIKSGYHIQSAFAADGYIPARLLITSLPAGVSADAVLAQKGTDIPTPSALGTGTLSVYSGKAYFLVPLHIAPSASQGPATIQLRLKTQACTDTTCDPPVEAPLSVSITIAAAGASQKQLDAALFAAAHAQQFAPQPVPETKPATTTASTPSTTVSTSPGKQIPLLSPAEQVALIASRPYVAANSAEHVHSLPIILLFALLGGLILNIMPCVLPVIPLKALSFIQQAHGNAKLARLHGLAFSAGIVALFIALALILRLFNLFYGQQFQSPAFLITMTMFVVALALSMLGVWTIQPPRAVYAVDDALARGAGESTLLGSFSSGLMATLLATPCSAPFLGPVLAWALVQPAALTAGILALVGVGMALPYLALAYFPQALSKIPRAGRWSELLKQALGIVMLAVAIYLVTLVPSTHLWPWIFAGAIVLSLVCWAWGQIPTPLMAPASIWTIRTVAVVVGILLSLGIYKIAVLTAPSPTINAEAPATPMTAFLADKTESAETWLPFNLALLDQALKDGRPVLVDWTADWCINCRVLEATVLKNPELHRAIVDKNALLLRADLSQDNPPADALNQKLGSRSIPVLAIFHPSAPTTPTVLRDTYSPSRVIQEIHP
jgi:thiol:disulfide interchange protein DsbD